MIIGTVWRSVVVDWVRETIHAIVPSNEESEDKTREVTAKYPDYPGRMNGYPGRMNGRYRSTHPAGQFRCEIELHAEELAGLHGDRWAPTLDRLVFCGLPDGHLDRWHFAVFVTRWSGDLWDVKVRVYQVDVDGRPDVVSREADWTPYLMPLAKALEVAQRTAQTTTLRGKTADQILEAEAANA